MMNANFKMVLLIGLASLATATSMPPLINWANAERNLTASTESAQATEVSEPQGNVVAQARRTNGLASELQGKPTVVKIYADWCPACQRLRPVTNALQQQFNGRVNFVVFDVTNRSTTQAAAARARQLGLSNFLTAHRAQTSTVAILNPSNGQILTQFRYNFDQQDYVNGINRAIARINNVRS